MCKQTLLHVRQTQETAMDIDINVWRRNTAVPSMDQTYETCAKQKFEKTATDISNMERIRFRNTRQSDHRQRTRGVA